MPYRWTHESCAGSHVWVLKRNCAMSPRQCGLWFASLGGLSLGISMVFAAQGAWLVMPFAVLEVTGLMAAFYWFGRHAADYERIVARHGYLEVETSLGPRLERQGHSAPWFRVEYGGGPGDLIDVVAGREHVLVGRFVPSNGRNRLAQEIRKALRCATV